MISLWFLIATWANWSTWSKCIKTEWGGLQTKERTCMTYGKETPGTCIGRGSSSKSCSGVTKGNKVYIYIHCLPTDARSEAMDLFYGGNVINVSCVHMCTYAGFGTCTQGNGCVRERFVTMNNISSLLFALSKRILLSHFT